MAFLALTSGQCDADSPLDEPLFQLIRTNFDDHEARLLPNEARNNEAIFDDFTADTLSMDPGGPPVIAPWVWEQNLTVPALLDGSPDHWLHFANGAGSYTVIAASAYRMRIDLDRDHTVVMECRHKSAQSDNTAVWFMGFQDASLAVTGATCVTDQTDVIGFAQGSTAQTYKALAAKGGVSSTLQDNIGNAAVWSKLRLELTFAGATRQIRYFVDGTETSNSPFTTAANITLLKIRPLFGFQNGGGARNNYLDYVIAYWVNRPLST